MDYKIPITTTYGVNWVLMEPKYSEYGADDGNPNPDEAKGFQKALTARNIANTVTIYNGVGHAFVNPKDHRSGMPQAVDVWKQVISFMNETVSSGKVLTRRAQDLRAMSKCKGSSWAWIWDHTKDVFQGKGHFSHLRHNNRNLNESPPATK